MAKGFDIQGARKAGATDEQIAKYLAESQPNFDVHGALSAGASLDDIANEIDNPTAQKPQWQPTNTNPYNNSLIGRENKVANAVLNPFSTIAKSVGANPEVGSMMDKFSPIPAIAKGVEKFAGIPSAPNWQTGASRLGSGMTDVGMGALQTLNPVPFGAFGAGQEALGMVSPTAANVLQKVTNPVTSLSNPQTEIGQNAASAADLALQGLALQYGGKVKQSVGRGLENTASGMAGKAFHVGENFKDTRQLGKFAQERGYVVGKEGAGTISPFKGLSSAEKLQQTLNSEINSKIIDPATKAGVLIDGQSYVDALTELKKKLASDAVPDQTSLNAVDKMIDAAKERLTRTEVQGMLTPKEAQDMKVTGNKILSTVYSKKAQGAVYDEEIASKKRGRMAVTDELRTQLEQIHPELKNLNWNQGAVIDIMTSMQDYLNRKARGEGESNVSGYVSTALKPRLGIRDALMIDPVLSRMAVMLGKVGRGLSGNEPNNVSGASFPFSASRWNPPAPPPPSGLSVPPQPPVFGSPRNPQAKPFTPFSQAVDAEWSVENPMQPQQPNQLSAPKRQLGQGTLPDLSNAGDVVNGKPFGNIPHTEENRYFGSTVHVAENPETLDNPFIGKVQRVLNNGDLVEVVNDRGQVKRVDSRLVTVKNLVDNPIRKTAIPMPKQEPIKPSVDMSVPDGVFGLSWKELEAKQGGKIRIPRKKK